VITQRGSGRRSPGSATGAAVVLLSTRSTIKATSV
jgi:hypothetical protein